METIKTNPPEYSIAYNKKAWQKEVMVNGKTDMEVGPDAVIHRAA